MKKTPLIWRILAIVLSVALLLCAVGCGDADKTDSDEEVVYGDAVDTDDDDDVVSERTTTTTSTIASKSSGGNGNADAGWTSGSTGTISGMKQEHQVDENAKKDFLSTVPKNLAGKTVKILIWWQPGDAEVAKMKTFEKKTGIKIKWIVSSMEEYYQKLSAMKGQGASADLACIMESNFPDAILKDYFQPMTAGKLDLTDKSLFDLDMMNKYKWNNQYYGCLIKGSTMETFNLLYYNEDMFKKAGEKTPRDLWLAGNWNWDTFLDMCVKMNQKTGLPATTGTYHCFDFVGTANTGFVKVENNKLVNNLKDPALTKVYTFLNELRDKYKVYGGGVDRDGWIAQKSVTYMSGNYYLQRGDNFDRNVKFNYGYVPEPCPKGQTPVISASVKMWGFPTGSKNTEAASYALRYWQDPAFDEAGYELWTDSDAAAFNDWCWKQPKNCINSAIVNYGGNYSAYTMYYELFVGGVGNIASNLDKWSAVVDANIAALMKDYS